MPQEKKKFYPFSDTSVPDEYDGFLLLNKEETEYSKEKNPHMDFQENTFTPETNTGGKFDCLAGNLYNLLNSLSLCHIFTIIDKDEGVVGDWKDKCPTSLDSLRPFSLEGRDLVNKKYKDNFPKVFLVAMKWKKDKNDWFEYQGEKKIENIGFLSLSFKSAFNSSKRIFVQWYEMGKPKSNVVCDKSLLNLKNNF